MNLIGSLKSSEHEKNQYFLLNAIIKIRVMPSTHNKAHHKYNILFRKYRSPRCIHGQKLGTFQLSDSKEFQY